MRDIKKMVCKNQEINTYLFISDDEKFSLFHSYLFILAALGLHYCAQAFSLVAVTRGYPSLWRAVFSLHWLLLWIMGSRARWLQEMQFEGSRAEAQ